MTKKTPNPTVKRRKAQDAPGNADRASDVVPNSMALAKAMGVSPVTIKQWKRIAGCPSADAAGRYRISEWREWANANNRGAGKDESPTAISKADWEIERLKRIIAGMDINLAVRRKELIPVEDIRAWFVPLVLAIRNELLAIPGKLAAQVPGMNPPDAEAAMRDAINEALRNLSEHPWQDEPSSKARKPIPKAAE